MRLRLLLCLLLGFLPCRGAWAEGRQYAIVVGVDSYESAEVNPLRYAVADAHALAETLRAVGFQKVYELTSNERGSDDYPSTNNLLFRLGVVRDLLQPDDSLVVYFSGHGMEINGKTFLLTKESDPRSLETLKHSACAADDIKDILSQVKARRMLVMYDACRSEVRANKGGGANALSRTAARDLTLTTRGAPSADSVQATLFACSPSQRSYEWNAKRHGFFTWFIIEGLQGQAARNGKVTVASLFDYVTKHVAQAAREEGCEQQPFTEIRGTSLDAWVLTNGAAPSAMRGREARPQPTPSATPHPQPTPASVPQTAVAPSGGQNGPLVDPVFCGVWWTTYRGMTCLLYIFPDGTFTQSILRNGQPVPVTRGYVVARGGHYQLKFVQAASGLTTVTPGSQESGDYLVAPDGNAMQNRPQDGTAPGTVVTWRRYSH